MTFRSRVERYAPIEDVSVRSDSEGRIIDAYAAVFNTRQEIRDHEGHYLEELTPTTFERTLQQRAGRLQFMFNHGKTLYGTPSERFSMPLGVPIEVRADGRGLFTSSRFANTELADEVLELVETGAIRGMSFSGAFLKSRSGGRDPESGLPVKIRTETALREYGPTPFPAYQDARIEQVRHEIDDLLCGTDIETIAAHLAERPETERDAIRAALSSAVELGNDSDADVDLADPPSHGHVATKAQRQRDLRVLLAREKGILDGGADQGGDGGA